MNRSSKKILLYGVLLGCLQGSMMQAIGQSVLTLKEARTQALENNHRLLEQAAHIESAEIGYDIATSRRLPEVSATGSALYFTNPPSALFPDFISNVGLNAQYLIYGGDKITNGITAARLQIGVAETQKRLSEAELMLSVDQNYWELIRLQEQVALAEENQRFLEALIDEIQDYYDAGLIQKNDLLEAQVSLNEASLQLLQAQQGQSLARYSLAQKMGAESETDFVIPDSIEIGENDPLVIQSMMEQALSQRAEIQLQAQQLELTEIRRAIDDAPFRPQIALAVNAIYSYANVAEGGGGSEEAPALLEEHFTTVYPQLSLSIPIYRAGRRKLIRNQYSSKLLAQREALEETEALVELEIRQALYQLNESTENIKLSQQSVQQADENLRLLQNQFEAGTATGKDVLEAQAIKQRAYANFINAKAQHKINQSILMKAIGKRAE